MLKIEESLNLQLYTSPDLDLYLDGLSLCVADIETTGLSPASSQMILGGLAFYPADRANGEARFVQYFAESLKEEKEVLIAYTRELAAADVVLTFNGKHFDIAYIDGRLRRNYLQFDDVTGFDAWPHDLDLYLVADGFSQLRRYLPNLRQKTIEDYLGLWANRDDDISGGESVELYGRYLALREKDDLDKILLHNADDVRQLARLLRVVEKCDLHRAMHCLGFPAGKRGEFVVESIKMNRRDGLRVLGRQAKDAVSYVSFGDEPSGLAVEASRFNADFEVRLPLIYKEGLLLADLCAVFGDTPAELACYEACAHGYLILAEEGRTNYREANHFVKLLLAKVSEEIR